MIHHAFLGRFRDEYHVSVIFLIIISIIIIIIIIIIIVITSNHTHEHTHTHTHTPTHTQLIPPVDFSYVIVSQMIYCKLCQGIIFFRMKYSVHSSRKTEYLGCTA